MRGRYLGGAVIWGWRYLGGAIIWGRRYLGGGVIFEGAVKRVGVDKAIKIYTKSFNPITISFMIKM